MTKKEASFILMLAKNRVCDNELNEALDMAIKALEQERSRSAEITQYRYDCEKLMEENERLKKALDQELILDKIRTEIEDTGAYEQEAHGKTEFLKGIAYCLSIIDKYKVESEE